MVLSLQHFLHQVGRGWLLVRGDEDPGCLENSTTNATVSLLSTEDLSVVVGPTYTWLYEQCA